MSLSLCTYVVPMGIAQLNDTINGKKSHIPYTNNPLKSPIPYSSTLSSGLFRGLNPNDRPNPDPATDVSPEGRKVRFPNCIRSDTGRIKEEVPEGVGSQFVPVAMKNYGQNLWEIMIRIWYFPLLIEAFLPYGQPVFLSHILLLYLVQARMVPATT